MIVFTFRAVVHCDVCEKTDAVETDDVRQSNRDFLAFAMRYFQHRGWDTDTALRHRSRCPDCKTKGGLI